MSRLRLNHSPRINPLLLAIVVLASGLLSACTAATSTPRASAAQSAACRQRADEVHERQNRADLFRSDTHAGGTRDAMFSGTGSPAASIGFLSARFARDKLVDECLRGAAGNVASTPDAPPPVITITPAAPTRRPGS